MKIVISSGHGLKVRGASGYLDEVDEARRVVNQIASIPEGYGISVRAFHDDVSTTQNENLNRIVDFHNSQSRDLDVSVHFNAYQTTPSPRGTECFYVTQDKLAGKIAAGIAAAGGLINRGPKKNDGLFFLNNTAKPAILIEVCFVDSKADADLYKVHFAAICRAIVEAITGGTLSNEKPPQPEPPKPAELPEGWSQLLSIEPVTIWQMLSGRYVAFISDLDICNDGTGPSHGDPHHNPETAYWNGGNCLNADIDKYIVIPPQIRQLIPHKIMGSQGRVTNIQTGIWSSGMCGDIGPDDKTGEAAYCLASSVNPQVSYNTGDKRRIYLYELWPGIPATVDGKIYTLE